MIPQIAKGIKYYQFSNLIDQDVTQAVFTRLGGASLAPWDSLNVGNTVGDDRINVQANLKKILDVIGYQHKQIAQVRQVHSANVVVIDEANWSGDSFLKADAMVTNQPGILLLMRFADCVPILLFDPTTRTVAIAHSGWMGTVNKIGFEVVRVMREKFGSKPEDLIVGIGPSIGPDHYQVGSNVIQAVKESYGDTWRDVLNEDRGGVEFDLWKANAITLAETGVENIEIAQICTGCRVDEWFSHRGDNGRTGRFAAVIGLV
jgi:YfiH family protein